MADLIELDLEKEDEESEVLVSYDIATYPSDFTLSGIYDMWKDGDITIPEFQRECSNIWSTMSRSSTRRSLAIVNAPSAMAV